MNDRLDDELARLREQLQADATRTADSHAVLADVVSERPTARVVELPRRPRGRIVAAAAAGALVAASVATIVVLRHDQGDETVPATVPPPTTVADVPATTTPVPATTAPATTVPATSLPATTLPVVMAPIDNILQSSFVDSTHGWVLVERRADQIAELRRTVDGSTWTTQDVPVATGLYGLIFADQQNGWIWGNGWWATHDGGESWKALPLGYGATASFPVYVVGHRAYALRFDGQATYGSMNFTLISSPVDADQFTDQGLTFPKGPGGNDVEASIATQGINVWVSYNDRGAHLARITGTTIDTTWAPPHAHAGGNFALTVFEGGGPLYATTETGIWGGDGVATMVVERSTDGGDTFTPIVLPDAAGANAYQWTLDAIDLNTVIAQSYRDSDGRVLLYQSHDQGVTWTQLSPVPKGAALVRFHDGIATAAVDNDTHHQLWVSSDGAHTWRLALG